MNQPTEEQISFLLNLKLSNLRREKLSTLTYQQIEHTLLTTRWAKGRPMHINTIARDIDELTVEDIVNCLTREAMVGKNDLTELTDQIKGEGK